ncbi:MAG: DUF2515 family protein [Cyanobacteria bacterium P01_A01_bin.123]
METQSLTEQFRHSTLARRKYFGLNNPRRTDYYLAYWQKHPEITWALLANLVSRNTGWMMSDLVRASKFTPHSPKIPGFPPAHYQAFFAFLETGNFLIFRDVFPQLEAYDWAKRHPGQSDDFFNALQADSEFEADPFMIKHWQVFFNQAKNNHWFPENWQEPAVQRLAFAQVANEQNQIHDRLVHDPQHRYLGCLFSWITQKIFIATTQLDLMKICFPVARSETDPTTDHVLTYTLYDFNPYANRVNFGRDLYVELFGDATRRKRVIASALAHPRFRGSRAQYNPQNYCLHPRQAHAEIKYSPPLVPWRGYAPAWPFNPTHVRPYSHLQDTPVSLAMSANQREGINDLLAPLTLASRPLKQHALSDLAELVIGKSSAMQLSILLQKMLGQGDPDPVFSLRS